MSEYCNSILVIIGLIFFFSLFGPVLWRMVINKKREAETIVEEEAPEIPISPDVPTFIWDMKETDPVEEVKVCLLDTLVIKRENHPNSNYITLHFKHKIGGDNYWSSEYFSDRDEAPDFAEAITSILGVHHITVKKYELGVMKADAFEFYKEDNIFAKVVDALCDYYNPNEIKFLDTIYPPPPSKHDDFDMY